MKKNFLLLLFVLLSSTAFSQFIEGRYYTHDGQRVDGLIQHVFNARFSKAPDNYIDFKPEKGAKKKKLTTKEVKSFVINKDSFIILKNFALHSLAQYDEDFVKVVKSGKINLYLHHTTKLERSGGVSMPTDVKIYLLEKNGKVIPMGGKNDLEDNRDILFGDDKEFAVKIQGRKLKGNEIESIIEEYNSKNK